MTWRGILCALMALGVLVIAAPAGAEGTCEIGYADGADSSPDVNGDGLVCVDLETGAVGDNSGQHNPLPGARDRNGNGVVCGKLTGNGMLITVDDNAANPANANCPPAFQPIPIS